MSRSGPSLLTLLAACVALSASLAPLHPAAAAPADGPADAAACQLAGRAEERRHDIPLRLLVAISLAETGRWDGRRQAKIAWPWTVHAEGRGRHLPDKASAIALVRRLQARGVRNIDVGCMQVNLKYHPDAFADLDQAFDPSVNTAVAARFLKRLQQRHRSWSQAVAHYHSATRRLNRPYRRKVMRLWHLERRQYFESRRLAAQAAHRARRDALRAARAGSGGRPEG